MHEHLYCTVQNLKYVPWGKYHWLLILGVNWMHICYLQWAPGSKLYPHSLDGAYLGPFNRVACLLHRFFFKKRILVDTCPFIGGLPIESGMLPLLKHASGKQQPVNRVCLCQVQMRLPTLVLKPRGDVKIRGLLHSLPTPESRFYGFDLFL